MRHASDTIFAVSSGAGRGAVALIRLSGAKAGEALERLCGGRRGATRRAAVRTLRDPRTAEPLDQALTLWLPGPASFTGEDMAELHVHGGRAVVNGVIEALASLEGLRPAEPGEFSRRAFDNHRLDLVEAEGLADLVAAETAAQRRQALRQFGGALGRLYDEWRSAVLDAMALAEAGLDFSDQDLPAGLDEQVRRTVERLIGEISTHLDDGRCGELVRDGLEIAILGAPNAGKSSLLNALARRDVAIVAATAGTTRDVIEVRLDVGGYPVILADTAGLREATEEVEAEGVRRALARAESADLKLVVLDGETWPAIDANIRKLIDSNTIIVLNKIDRIAGAPPIEEGGQRIEPLSCRSGAGLDRLIARLEGEAAARMSDRASPALSQARHRVALEECRDALFRSLSAPAVELRAEDLRLASRALGRITGRIDVEDVLDQVFRAFCIGK